MGIKINEEDVITIQVTNNNKKNNKNISQKIEDNILQNEEAQMKEIKDPATQIVDVKVEEKKKEKLEGGEVSNKTLLEVVEAKAGCWNRQLFILNPDLEITSTIKQTFEALSASSLEEETYPPVGLSLNTDIGFDLGDTLNTPTTNTTGSILDRFLADTEMMAMAESEKWEKSLDDLFPDLD